MNDLVFGPMSNTVPCQKCRELMILRIREIAGLSKIISAKEQTIETLRKKLRTAYDQNTVQRKRARRQHEDYRDFVTEEEDDRRD